MRKLWLHIGSHKTGTTSIQSALHQAQTLGKLDQLTYLNAGPKRSNISLISSAGEGADFHPSFRWGAIERCLDKAGDRDAVISSEGLFWLSEAKKINRLATRLQAQFDEIQLVVYLRRQDQLALSHRKQVAMGLHAARFYGVQAAALPRYQPHFQRFFDYAGKLALWQDAFGRNAIHLRRYDRALLKDGDAVRDFFDLIGQNRFVPQKNVNPPLSRSQLLVALHLQQIGHSASKVIRPLIADLPEDGPLLPARAEARAFLAHFADSNRALAQRFAPDGPADFFASDMGKYPEVGNDQLAALELDLAAIEQQAKQLNAA